MYGRPFRYTYTRETQKNIGGRCIRIAEGVIVIFRTRAKKII